MLDDHIKRVLEEATDKMDKALEHLRTELTSIRAGRASPAMLEHLRVDYYGTQTPLNQMASVSAPQPDLLMVQPWDTSALAEIEKAILVSDLGLTPSNDGKAIRLTLPPLTQERRQELVRVVNSRVEEGRVSVRNIRRDVIKDLREFENEKMISEDDLKRGEDEIQKLTDEYVEKMNRVAEEKEEEILEV